MLQPPYAGKGECAEERVRVSWYWMKEMEDMQSKYKIRESYVKAISSIVFSSFLSLFTANNHWTIKVAILVSISVM